MQADRAEALAASGADPAPAARKALELDDLARKYGHRDKELSAERRAAVERLLADRSGSDPGAGARKSVSD
jgi:aromatic ring hydroxylase